MSDKLVALHCIFVDCITILLWLIGLGLMTRNFHRTPGIRSVLKVTATVFVLGYLIAWIMWLFVDIALYEAATNDDTVWKTFGLYRTSLMIYSAIKVVIPLSAFYVFIGARLKLTFRDTMYEVSNSYFIVVGIIGFITISLDTFRRVFQIWEELYAPSHFEGEKGLHLFCEFCMYQFYIIDSLIKLSVVFIFNGRLIQLITMQRDDLRHSSISISSTDQELSKRQSIQIANQMNDRQTELLETISKHTLLICLMVSGNLIWFMVLAASSWEYTADGVNGVIGSVVSTYIFMLVNLLQLICLYLGFPFAIKRYNSWCPKMHKLCAKCCRRIAVRETSRSIQNYYRELADDSITDDRL